MAKNGQAKALETTLANLKKRFGGRMRKNNNLETKCQKS